MRKTAVPKAEVIEAKFDSAWRKKVIPFQMPVFSENMKRAWTLRFDLVLADQQAPEDPEDTHEPVPCRVSGRFLFHLAGHQRERVPKTPSIMHIDQGILFQTVTVSGGVRSYVWNMMDVLSMEHCTMDLLCPFRRISWDRFVFLGDGVFSRCYQHGVLIAWGFEPFPRPLS